MSSYLNRGCIKAQSRCQHAAYRPRMYTEMSCGYATPINALHSDVSPGTDCTCVPSEARFSVPVQAWAGAQTRC